MWQWSTVVQLCHTAQGKTPPLLTRSLVLTQPLSLVWFLDFLNADFLLKGLGSL